MRTFCAQLRFSLWPTHAWPSDLVWVDTTRAWLSPGVLRFFLRLCPALFASSFLLGCFRFWAGLLMLVLVTQAAQGGADARLALYLALLALVMFGSALLHGVIAARMVQRVQSAYWQALVASGTPLSSRSTLERVVSRDLDIVAAWAEQADEVLRIPTCWVGTALLASLYYGRVELLATLGLLVFVPVSAVLGVLGGRAMAAVLRVSRERIELMGGWLRWSNYLLDWQWHGSLAKVHAKLLAEARQRDWDSVVRSLEGYVLQFGRVVPLIAAVHFASTPGAAAAPSLALFWLAAPVMALTLGIGRSLAELRQAQLAYDEMRSLVRPVTLDERVSLPIVPSVTWSLWTGTVRDNLLNLPQSEAALRALNLVPELGPDVEAVQRLVIHGDGANVSAGQRIRLLLARALGLAAHTSQPLQNELPLAALDHENRQRVGELLGAFGRDPKVDASVQAADGIDAPPAAPARSNVDSAIDDAPRAPHWGLFARWAACVVTFLVPATVVGGLGSASTEATRHAPGSLLAAAVGGVATAAAIGYLLERQLRRWAIARVERLLREPPGPSEVDLYQRVTRDLTTVMQRIAWYLHDSGWICSLLLLSTVATVGALNATGAAVVLAMVTALVFFWRKLMPVVVRLRRANIAAQNELVESAHALLRSDHLIGVWSHWRDLRARLSAAGFQGAYRSRVEMMLSKAALGHWVELAFVLGTGALSLLLAASSAPLEVSAFVLSAALAANQQIVQLYLALTGYRAQSISLERIDANVPRREEAPDRGDLDASELGSTFEETAGELGMAACHNHELGLTYRPARLRRGALTSLVGASGAGKTQVLKTWARFGTRAALRDSVYYFDEQWQQVAAWADSSRDLGTLTDVLERLPVPKLLLLDEVFRAPTDEAHQQAIEDVRAWARRHNVAVVLVDHRTQVDARIDVADLTCPTGSGRGDARSLDACAIPPRTALAGTSS